MSDIIEQHLIQRIQTLEERVAALETLETVSPAATPYVGPPVNLLQNGNMESWAGATAPDLWTLVGAGGTAGASGTAKQGTYSARLNAAITTLTYLDQSITWDTYWQSKEVDVGAWVYSAVATRVRIAIDDGVGVSYSDYHTGGSTWEWLTVNKTMGGAASELTVRLEITSGAAMKAYFDGVILIEHPEVPTIWEPHAGDLCYLIGPYQTGKTYIYNNITIQSGLTPAAGGDLFVIFPLPFAVILGVLVTAAGANNRYWVNNVTVNGFTARRVGTASAGVYWMAWGILPPV